MNLEASLYRFAQTYRCCLRNTFVTRHQPMTCPLEGEAPTEGVQRAPFKTLAWQLSSTELSS